jgi:uncharacterized membrane protein
MIVDYPKIYAVIFVILLAIDILWLALMAHRFYVKYFGFLLKTRPIWSSAIVFYFLFVAGVLVFMILQCLHIDSVKKRAIFGPIAYGTYDLTNLALVKEWPCIVTVVDVSKENAKFKFVNSHLEIKY